MKIKNILITLLLLPLTVLATPQPGDFFADGPRTDKKIALSFDDGPGPYTKQFLDLLDEYQVKGTFFMLGDRVKGRKAIAKEVADRGHEIGGHSMSHVNYKKVSGNKEAKLMEDMSQTRTLLETVSGQKLNLYRMPHGIDRPWIKQVAKESNFVLVNWTYGADWGKSSAEEISKGYIKALRPGTIFLFHDGGSRRQKSVEITRAVIEAAKEKGYEVVTVGELLGLPD